MRALAWGDVVAVRKLDRLARSTRDLLRFASERFAVGTLFATAVHFPVRDGRPRGLGALPWATRRASIGVRDTSPTISNSP
jgi:hypothetical protein